jgi:hypothetical protein
MSKTSGDVKVTGKISVTQTWPVGALEVASPKVTVLDFAIRLEGDRSDDLTPEQVVHMAAVDAISGAIAGTIEEEPVTVENIASKVAKVSESFVKTFVAGANLGEAVFAAADTRQETNRGAGI